MTSTASEHRRATDSQLGLIRILVEGTGTTDDDLAVLMAWARQTLSGYWAAEAISMLQTKDTRAQSEAALRLEQAAQKWRAEQPSDLPQPDEAGLHAEPDQDELPI